MAAAGLQVIEPGHRMSLCLPLPGACAAQTPSVSGTELLATLKLS